MNPFPLKSVALILLLICSASVSQAHEAAKEEPAAAPEASTKPGYVPAQAAPIPSAKAQKHSVPLSNAKTEVIVKQLNPQSLKKKTKKKAFPPGQIELAIEFKGDTDQLEDSSLPLLQNLGSALQDKRLQASSYVIEGHTESRGSARYSFLLSKQQADAVRSYLIEHGIGANRLRSEGKGFKEPQDESNPLASSNRRIRVVLVTPD